MAINFLWYGPFRDEETCVATPNAVAEAKTIQDVVFWCKKEYEDQFDDKVEPKLAPTVRVRNCDTVKDIVGDAVYKGNPWYEQADSVLAALVEHKAWAAIKDLLVMVILYEHGGFYFDTTCVIPRAETVKAMGGASLRDGLAAAPDTVMVPQVPGRGMTHQPLLMSGDAIVKGKDSDQEIQDTVNAVRFWMFDIWAMGAPAKDPILETAIMSFVSRYNKLAVNQHDEPADWLGADGKKILDSNLRNTLLGQVSIRSLADGLVLSIADQLGEAPSGAIDKYMDPHLWKGEQPEDTEADGNIVVPALGMAKKYRSTWRTTN